MSENTGGCCGRGQRGRGPLSQAGGEGFSEGHVLHETGGAGGARQASTSGAGAKLALGRAWAARWAEDGGPSQIGFRSRLVRNPPASAGGARDSGSTAGEGRSL